MKETVILSFGWVLTIIVLIILIPRDKIREAELSFLFMQVLTWVVGLLVVELRLIEYPVEIFKYATKSSFTFEYFIYPAICAVFNVRYPQGASFTRQFLYYCYFCSVITIVEVLCEKYTNIIKYIHWSWWITWITVFISFYISRKYYVWFFKLKRNSI